MLPSLYALSQFGIARKLSAEGYDLLTCATNSPLSQLEESRYTHDVHQCEPFRGSVADPSPDPSSEQKSASPQSLVEVAGYAKAKHCATHRRN